MKQRYIPKWKSKFYKSKEWKQVRQTVINRDKGVCFFCGKLILDSIEVHHVIELNESNVNDSNISLNPNNLVCTHIRCHNEHHQKGFKRKESIVDEDLNIDYERREI